MQISAKTQNTGVSLHPGVEATWQSLVGGYMCKNAYTMTDEFVVSIPGMENAFPELSGAVLVCSVPPSGNSGLVLRYLFSKPVAAFKVTLSLAAKGFQKSIPLCRETFFSQAMDDQLVKRYQDLMIESSRMPLFDLRKLNASLPVPKPMENSTNVLVLGAKDDFIVDDEGLKETGRFYEVEPVCIEGVAHDMMLDCSWEKGSEVKERNEKC
ncbi:hypothetical protein ARALYDRAFT_356158 [Arabidopsis lyrata subsp. lyrata]|uniref:Uncharacterized protein n=1 Tax=Arabidopsis lyrata subsp. lyrata TaxID=81972 RepID=D7MK02_ARALL|nr:hypothetical protein ARALYDRAFT_356158 [Arabidopsis lyrata subsp. lyrata]